MYYGATIVDCDTGKITVIRVTGRGVAADTQAVHYRVAGQALACQNAMRGLDAFESGLASRHFTDLLTKFVEPAMMTATNSTLRYSGRAYFDGEFRDVRFWQVGELGQIDIDRVPACQIDFGDSHIHVLNCEPLGSGLNLELITGPALVLLLAQTQVYCMHAGAVDTNAGRIGIVAESGSGKSTLSAHHGAQWSQVSDDIMPLVADDREERIDVLPDFPQLKLSGNVIVDSPKARKPLDYLLRINPVPSEKLSFAALSRTEAMLQVVRHTVAAKLFDSNALHQHAGFARKVSMCVPVIEISYPRNIDQLSSLRESIVDYLGGLNT